MSRRVLFLLYHKNVFMLLNKLSYINCILAPASSLSRNHKAFFPEDSISKVSALPVTKHWHWRFLLLVVNKQQQQKNSFCFLNLIMQSICNLSESAIQFSVTCYYNVVEKAHEYTAFDLHQVAARATIKADVMESESKPFDRSDLRIQQLCGKM